jgi:hypothetical protein
MKRLFLYLRPHLFGVAFAVPIAWGVAKLASLGGSCNALCRPGVAPTMGLLAGLLGAQLYRSENPIARDGQ